MVRFNVIGYADRRFYRKVVREAKSIIQQVLDAAGFPISQNYAAEFDTNTSHPTLTHRFNNKIDCHAIQFGTQYWEPGRSAPDAANQVASILVIQFPDQPLTNVFIEAGLAIGPARRCKVQLSRDDYDDVAVFITTELSLDSFFRLAEEIDQLVAESGLGDVSGTGCGIGGWCIDLTALNVGPCLELVTSELRARNLHFHVPDDTR